MDAVRLARTFTDDVQFSAEDATRSDPEFLWHVVEAVIQSGAKTINLPDTVGYSTPDEMQSFFCRLINRVPSSDQVIWSTHCHDDLGLAVANTLAALTGGARQVECTINGIGERAGNASLEEVVMATRVRADRLPFETGIDTKQIYAASQLLTALTGEAVQANKAIVGRNAFAHEAGIHQDGMLKDRRTYEIMSPEDVGVPKATLVLGKHSGRHAVQRRCEDLGVKLERHELDRVYRGVIAHADREKTVSDADLLKIVETARTRRTPVAPTRRRCTATATASDRLRRPRPAEKRLRSRRLNASILLLPGDGIGPEVVAAAERVLRAVAERLQSLVQSQQRRHRRRCARAGPAAAPGRHADGGACRRRHSARRGRRSRRSTPRSRPSARRRRC